MSDQPFSELIPEGVIGFPVTPFHADYALNLEGFKKNLEVILQEPFTTFVAAGGTGEMYSLDREEYVAVVQSAVNVTEGRMPVIAGVGYGSRIAVSMATEAAKAGAAALLILPPYYPNPAFEGLAAYCKAIGNATKPSHAYLYPGLVEPIRGTSRKSRRGSAHSRGLERRARRIAKLPTHQVSTR